MTSSTIDSASTRRVLGAERLGADLPELAVAAGLRALVAEEAREVPELDRLAALVHAMLDVRAADGRGALGAQRQRAPGDVLEREHLLAHDVGRLADAAREQLGRLERRRLDPLVSCALEQRACAGLERRALLRLLAEHVERAARRFELRRAQVRVALASGGDGRARHALAQLAEERVRVALAAERRDAHVPGVDDGLGRVGAHQRDDRALERRPVAAGQVDAADGALEEDVAGEQRDLAGDRAARAGLGGARGVRARGRDRVGDVTGAVAGREEHVDVEAGERQTLAAGDGVLGLVALERAEAGRHEAHHVGEQRALDLGAVDGRAGRARERRDGADVVEVAVREEDRLDPHAELRDRVEQPLRLLAGIDDDGRSQPVGAGRRVGGADDEAVLLDGADGERAHVERAHFDAALPPPACPSWPDGA